MSLDERCATGPCLAGKAPAVPQNKTKQTKNFWLSGIKVGLGSGVNSLMRGNK